jgi:hypothetical protein
MNPRKKSFVKSSAWSLSCLCISFENSANPIVDPASIITCSLGLSITFPTALFAPWIGCSGRRMASPIITSSVWLSTISARPSQAISDHVLYFSGTPRRIWWEQEQFANDKFRPVRSRELITGEINSLARQVSLDAPTKCQDNRKSGNNDGGNSSSEFRRPIHWDWFTFYTTLGGLLGFAAMYASILWCIARDRR